MLVVIFIGLLIMPLSSLFFGGLFIKQKIKFIDMRLFLSAGIISIFFDFFDFYKTFQYSLQRSQWGTSANVMGEFSILASLHTLVFALFVCLIFSLFRRQKKSLQGDQYFSKLQLTFSFLICFSYFVFHAIRLNGYEHKAHLYQSATQNQLTLEEAKRILKEAEDSQDVYLMMSVLENANCPVEILQEYFKSEKVALRSAVAVNTNAPTNIVDMMSQDKEYVVRMKVASHRNTSTEILLQMTEDSAKEVRRQAVVELKQRKMNGQYAGEVPAYKN